MEMEARSFSAERSRALMVKALCPPPLPASLCVLLPPGAATLYIKKASPRMATRTGTRGLEVPLSTPGRLTCAQGSPRAAVRFTRKGRPGVRTHRCASTERTWPSCASARARRPPPTRAARPRARSSAWATTGRPAMRASATACCAPPSAWSRPATASSRGASSCWRRRRVPTHLPSAHRPCPAGLGGWLPCG